MEHYPTTPLKYLWYYVRRKKKDVFWMVAWTVLGTICAQVTPYYFSRMIDILNEGIHKGSSFGQDLFLTIAMMLLLELLFLVFRRISYIYELRFFPWLAVQSEKDVSSYLLGHSARFLADQTSGKLASRAGQLAHDLEKMMNTLEWEFFTPSIEAIVTLVLLLRINWTCGVLFVMWTAVLFLVFKKYAHRLCDISADLSEKNASVVGRVVDVVANALTVKGFSNRSFEEKGLNSLLAKCRKSLEKLIRTDENIRMVQRLTVLSFRLSMIGLTLFLWYLGKASAGSIVLTLLLVNSMTDSVRYFMYAYDNWNRTKGDVSNALTSIFVPHEIQDDPHAKKLQVRQGKVEFKNVDFGYRVKTGVFKKFNLTIEPGERVGLVGVSGSGKTSLINLLQRFYDVNAGQILIDDQDIRSVTQDSLHSAISLVPQDTSLFHRSLYDNIAYGNPQANKNQVMRASRLAYAHDFIAKTEKGYQTFVGDRGIKLSGGQRQRIAIARAILKQAPILILDEATSALDSESEIHIQKSLKTLMKGKTVIAIAHRLSTLREMDRIIVMQRGKIIEEGKPAELLKQKGKYAHLWRLQTQGFILPE